MNLITGQVFILHGYESLDQFREVEEQDLDSLGIKDPDTRTRILEAVSSILEYEQNSIVGHVSEASVTNNTSSSSRDSGCFTDHKGANTSLVPTEYGAAEGRQSSPSTDNSSGYQGRGNYSIAHTEGVSSTLQEVPDTTLDSPSSNDGEHHDVTAYNTEQQDSYRATPVTVRPGTPDLPQGAEDSPVLRKKTHDNNIAVKTSTPRSSNDTGVSLQSGQMDELQ